ncbi:1-deoxy-D-xylulose-5-phosphate synthase [Candidatus Schneideria nysicola]|uniref:1-deoxy-D-xylulose-5-phosphate synthase n=1 Tax=Candidatus Schneideria nysicola TaxID=1081631 RepID=UPI001CAA6E5B|nr:1-deoxy-D-xylulose-5-phosphate synthase [Candidatus Schneideria nysicola]UAJ65743.1 1-deoxy-D-xylulose-5-phosphate synthase [Candidatus Schneideria nysicola]UAJ66270.1 1-deoxy-D-xylulose-5-phosphate synthase [Candidatus Schneideria nysicola]
MTLNSKLYPILSRINDPKKLRNLTTDKLIGLCQDIRKFLIESISRSSGHFASGLGVIELTVALHYIYNTPFDRLIWDVGHQSYPHKILTGRIEHINTIRQFGGLHPFPCHEESEYDSLSVGHSSTSISAGLGMSVVAEREGMGRRIVCVIGDGSMTAGMAFEAMNHAGYIQSDILVILNDNEMSISENVGALKNYLSRILSTTSSDNPGTLFEELGFNYIGPVDGHDIPVLLKTLQKMRDRRGPQLLHVITQKGRGYIPAEMDPIGWHAVPKFDPAVGIIPQNTCSIIDKQKKTYSEIFGNWLCSTAAVDKKLMAITPAMREGSGMVTFARQYPHQYFDVAIAEQHAVTFAAGLAIGGYQPVVAIYSTFLQRAYDQLIHDIAIPKLPVLFAIDRGGIVGADGQTHQGAFDLSYLRCIPNMLIMTPSDENECQLMLYTGYHYKNGPSVVRYPRGESVGVTISPLYNLPLGKGVIRRKGKKIAILNFGTLLLQAIDVAEEINATLVDMRFVKPIDESLILAVVSTHQTLVTLEENVVMGGAGSSVNEFLMHERLSIPVLNIGLPDSFIPHGNQNEVRSYLGLDSKGIIQKINRWLSPIRRSSQIN